MEHGNEAGLSITSETVSHCRTD